MNTLEIFKFLKANKYAKTAFLGVYPIDLLPEISKYPASLVVNLDTSAEPGSHWVALYFNSKKHCEYFDSYGRSPVELESFIIKNSIRYTYNNIQVQDFDTVSCGHMCIYFIVFKARRFSFKNIVRSMCDKNVYKYFLKAPNY